MNLWPRFLRERWEAREREADEAERQLMKARATYAHVHRLAADSDRMKHANGFTEAIRAAMGVQS
jgi:hypothetical protein